MGSSCQKRGRTSHAHHSTCAPVVCLRRVQKGSLFMIRRYQECDGGSKHERLSALLRISSPDSMSDETGDAFAGARRGVHETRDTFAGGKCPEIGSFVRAEVSSVSNVCAKELAEVSVVSSRGSDPPALVSLVSGEAVGGCSESAVVPISAKKLAQQEWILGHTAKKFALQAKKR